MDPNSILDFIFALCDLSKKELENERLFLLSKLVEVADANMSRVKIIWSKMWSIMREHFLHAGTSNNINIAMYAIDQLK